MLRPRRVLLMLRGLAAALALASLATPAAARLRINGSTTVNPVVAEAAAILRRETGMAILVDTLGGSSGGIAALADGRAEIGMSSRPLEARDRQRYPGTDFRPVAFGSDAVALVVSRDVWEGGVRSLSRDETRRLYEGTIRNWRELGGPNRRVVFFDKEPGRGTWEVFADWLYSDADRAPLVSLPAVGSNAEARTKIGSTPGAIGQLSAAWADGERVFALAIRLADGRRVFPDPERLADGSYPMARPLLLLTDGPAGDEATRLIDLLLSPRGGKILTRHGYLPPAVAASREAP